MTIAMKVALGCFLLAVLVLAVSLPAIAGADEKRALESGSAEAKGELHHVVSLKFKESAKKEQIKAVEDAFAALKKKVPGISDIKWGTNVSPEKHDKGFTHCFILTFANEKDRDAYLVHADHKAFGKVLGPVMADVFVIDFWSKN